MGLGREWAEEAMIEDAVNEIAAEQERRTKELNDLREFITKFISDPYLREVFYRLLVFVAKQ